METLYVLNKAVEFEGHCIDSIHEVNINKEDFNKSILDYGDGETFGQRNEREGGNLIAITWNDFVELYQKPYLQSLQKPFKEITEEHYDDMLNCLPPQRWHNFAVGLNVFFMLEGYTGNLHSCYIADRANNKYYEALRPMNITDEQLLIDFKNK